MKFLRGVGLASMGMFIAFVICESLLRLFLAVVPPPSDSPYVSDPHAAYRLRPTPAELVSDPDVDHINNLGYRGREHSVSKPAGTYRILGIGDSFVYGNVPLEDNFLRVAEDSMAADFGRGTTGSDGSSRTEAEMILIGLGGYAPDNELGALKSFGLSLDPDLVVLNFFVGNDIVGLAMPARVYRGHLYFVGSFDPWLNLARKSRIALLAESALVHARNRGKLDRTGDATKPTDGTNVPVAEAAGAGAAGADMPGEDAPGTQDDRAEDVGRDDSLPVRVNPMYLRIQEDRVLTYLVDPGPRMSRLWDAAEDYVLEFDRVCRENGVPWILHVIPAEVQVDPDVADQVFRGFSLDPGDFDLDLPQRRLRELCEREDIVILDQLDYLREQHRSDDRLYIPNDTHWNVKGNRLAGEALARFILEDFSPDERLETSE